MDATARASDWGEPPDPATEPLFIVGVGASAGGLEALERLFEGVHRTGRHAFVVIQHLSPDFKSLMDELLARHTSLRIHRAEDGMEVEPDCIYLLPPKKELLISQGRLVLRDRVPDQMLSLPIDAFFSSLARDAGKRAIAVVLSGTGSDGSRGVRAIHEAGGLVLAQSEESARFDGMPRAAVETGIVDAVLAPEELGPAIARYAEHGGRLELAGDAAGGERDAMGRILDLLKKETGVDFSGYKPTTVGRRIERRLVMSETQDLDQYLSRIENDPAEVRSLYKDLLIGVTRFFRDPEAFDALRREILPGAVERLASGEELRVWVPACATGEEAFSIAILIQEAFRSQRRPAAMKLFATDIHRASLDVASAGIYSADAMVNVPPDLRDRYFQKVGGEWTVAQELRGAIVFAQHNLLRDAPFTRLDLVSCRNFLIYLNPAPQHKVLNVFHYALKASGALLLGPSETTGALADEFSLVEPRWKIFRKRRDVRLPAEIPLPAVADLGGRVVRARGPEEDPRVRAARDLLLQAHAPPTLLVDESFRLVHAFNGASRFFVPRDGPPSTQVLDLLSGELKIVVGGALKRALKERHAVEFAAITVPLPGGSERVTVSVAPIAPEAQQEGGLLVRLQPTPVPSALPPPADLGALNSERVASLEHDLRHAQENLQATVEEMETSNEELQATNEELIASNEELQSTNEELHSVNEELYTVNAEYQAKIAELTELTADVNHLLESTQVHTLFLDRDLRLRKFTPRMGELFNLLPQDVGRRIEGFAHGLEDDHLLEDLARVLASGQSIEREVRDGRGSAFLLRILPYRPAQRVDGVVLTLVDVAALKRAQHELQRSEARYRTLVRAVASVVWTADAQGRFSTPQGEWEAYTGQPWEAHRGDGWLQAFHPDDREALRSAWTAAVAEGAPFDGTGRLWNAGRGEHRRFTLRAVPVREEGGAVREWVGNVVDVHDAWLRDAALHERTAQLEGFLEHSPAFLWVKDEHGRYLLASRSAQAVLGAPPDAVRGKTDRELATAPMADAVRGTDRRVAELGTAEEVEEELPWHGERRTFLSVKFPLRGDPAAIAGISTDISDRKRASDGDREAIERRDWLLAMLSHELRTPLGAILNATELLDTASLAPGRRDAARAIIRRQSRQMAHLLDDLLDVARLTRDQLVLRKKPVDLVAVVRDAAEASRSSVEKKGLTLTLALPEREVPLVGDPIRLQQIVANVIANAVKYTEQGSVAIELRVSEASASLHVRDTGLGMTPGEQERAFELFYQAPQRVDRPLGGLGIGLHLARRLARLHGGDLRGASEGKGKGSEFVLTLPIDPTVQARAAATPSSSPARLRIAIVEDNDDIREVVKDLLELAGHDVVAAADGTSGAALIVEQEPDVALVDLGLPGIDGLEVARRVRDRLGGAIALIALTGYGGPEYRTKARDAGFDEHLLKPVDSDRLLDTVAAVAARNGRPFEPS